LSGGATEVDVLSVNVLSVDVFSVDVFSVDVLSMDVLSVGLMTGTSPESCPFFLPLPIPIHSQ
jgi:hypothetical protein